MIILDNQSSLFSKKFIIYFDEDKIMIECIINLLEYWGEPKLFYVSEILIFNSNN